VSGSASGRRSPWVGHVDVSVFLATTRPAAVAGLADRLRHTEHVRQVYFESAADAYAEYQRLYTCSAAVPRSAVPASYRLVLDPVDHAERDALVRRIGRMPGVRDVACDPSDPCVSAASK
jgi:FtsX-like permease family protein